LTIFVVVSWAYVVFNVINGCVAEFLTERISNCATHVVQNSSLQAYIC